MSASLVSAGCGGGLPPFGTAGELPPTERMPAPASIWLTARPASPTVAVDVELAISGNGFNRGYAFPAGEPLRGSFPVSQGSYQLTAMDGACELDLQLPPEREADVVIAVDDGGSCSFELAAMHVQDAVSHEGPSIEVVPPGVESGRSDTPPGGAGALTCPGDQWPPFGAPGALAGITARAIDRARLQIANTTQRPWYVRVSGWEVADLESCRGLVEGELVGGPIAPAEVMDADVSLLMDRPDVPIAVSVYAGPCSEGGCAGDPVAVIFVERSNIEPVPTDGP